MDELEAEVPVHVELRRRGRRGQPSIERDSPSDDEREREACAAAAAAAGTAGPEIEAAAAAVARAPAAAAAPALADSATGVANEEGAGAGHGQSLSFSPAAGARDREREYVDSGVESEEARPLSLSLRCSLSARFLRPGEARERSGEAAACTRSSRGRPSGEARSSSGELELESDSDRAGRPRPFEFWPHNVGRGSGSQRIFGRRFRSGDVSKVKIARTLPTAEEAARARDRMIIACKGSAPSPQGFTLNFPLSEYQGESWYRALFLSEHPPAVGVHDESEDAKAAAERLHAFMEEHGMARPVSYASERAAAFSGVTYFGNRFRVSLSWKRKSFQSVFQFDSVETCAVWRDRFLIACYGKDEAQSRGLNFPVTEYEGEAWFRDLFPAGGVRPPPVGLHDTRADAAASFKSLREFMEQHGLVLPPWLPGAFRIKVAKISTRNADTGLFGVSQSSATRFMALFHWKDKQFHLPYTSAEEAALVRDRLLIAGVGPVYAQVRQLNHPLSRYEGESWYAALFRSASPPAVGVHDADGDPEAAMWRLKAFLEEHAAMGSIAPSGRRPRVPQLLDSGDDREGRAAPPRDPHTYAHGRLPPPKSGFYGVRSNEKGRDENRRHRFAPVSAYLRWPRRAVRFRRLIADGDLEEGARWHDRYAIACFGPAHGRLNFPASSYRGEGWFAALFESEEPPAVGVRDAGGDAGEAIARLQAFMEEHGVPRPDVVSRSFAAAGAALEEEGEGQGASSSRSPAPAVPFATAPGARPLRAAAKRRRWSSKAGGAGARGGTRARRGQRPRAERGVGGAASSSSSSLSSPEDEWDWGSSDETSEEEEGDRWVEGADEGEGAGEGEAAAAGVPAGPSDAYRKLHLRRRPPKRPRPAYFEDESGSGSEELEEGGGSTSGGPEPAASIASSGGAVGAEAAFPPPGQWLWAPPFEAGPSAEPGSPPEAPPWPAAAVSAPLLRMPSAAQPGPESGRGLPPGAPDPAPAPAASGSAPDASDLALGADAGAPSSWEHGRASVPAAPGSAADAGAVSGPEPGPEPEEEADEVVVEIDDDEFEAGCGGPGPASVKPAAAA
eukprot:tig00020943_g16291.t1